MNEYEGTPSLDPATLTPRALPERRPGCLFQYRLLDTTTGKVESKSRPCRSWECKDGAQRRSNAVVGRLERLLGTASEWWLTSVPYDGVDGNRSAQEVRDRALRRIATASHRRGAWPILKVTFFGQDAVHVLTDKDISTRKYGGEPGLSSSRMTQSQALDWVTSYIVPGLVQKTLPGEGRIPPGGGKALDYCSAPLARRAHASTLSVLSRRYPGVIDDSLILNVLIGDWDGDSWSVPVTDGIPADEYAEIFNAYVRAHKEEKQREKQASTTTPWGTEGDDDEVAELRPSSTQERSQP